MSSSIKLKTGNCKESGCGYNGPLLGGMCQSHYWAFRKKVKSDHRSVDIPAEKQSKRELELNQYTKKRKVWIIDHQFCEAKLSACKHQPTEVHHMQGREGKLLLDESKWLAACRSCHRWITDNSAEAIEKGLSISRNRL